MFCHAIEQISFTILINASGMFFHLCSLIFNLKLLKFNFRLQVTKLQTIYKRTTSFPL